MASIASQGTKYIKPLLTVAISFTAGAGGLYLFVSKTTTGSITGGENGKVDNSWNFGSGKDVAAWTEANIKALGSEFIAPWVRDHVHLRMADLKKTEVTAKEHKEEAIGTIFWSGVFHSVMVGLAATGAAVAVALWKRK